MPHKTLNDLIQARDLDKIDGITQQPHIQHNLVISLLKTRHESFIKKITFKIPNNDTNKKQQFSWARTLYNLMFKGHFIAENPETRIQPLIYSNPDYIAEETELVQEAVDQDMVIISHIKNGKKY